MATVPAGTTTSPPYQIAPLILGAQEAPIGNNPTPRHWKTIGASFPASRLGIKARRVPVFMYVTDKRTGRRKLKTIAYAIGDNHKEAVTFAQVIVTAVNGRNP